MTQAIAAAALVCVSLPLAKLVLCTPLKSGVLRLERTKGAITEAGEMLADIAAEAKAEVHATAYPSAPAKPGAITDSAAS